MAASRLNRWARVWQVSLICAAASVFTDTQLFADSNSQLNALFREQAPNAWKAYARRVEQLQSNYRFKSHLVSGSSEEVAAEYKRNQDCKLLVVKRKDRKQSDSTEVESELAFGLNAGYAFKLSRSNARANWVITEITGVKTNGSPGAVGQQFTFSRRDRLSLVHLGYMPLAELIDQPEFRVVNTRELRQDDEDLVEVEFGFPHKVDMKQPSWTLAQAGKLVLDPKHHWCVRGYEYQINSNQVTGTETMRLTEVEVLSDGFLVPRRSTTVRQSTMTTERTSETVKRVTESERTFTSPTSPPTDDEFTLTAFGLPEVLGFNARPPTPWWIWTLVAAIACALVAGVLYRLRARAVQS